MNNWYVGTFYTKNTEYENLFNKHLLPSLKKLNLDQKLITYKSKNYGSWHKNVAQKPRIIQNILLEMKSDDCLVFLDVDCEILKYPKLFDEIEEDFACHKLNWNEWYGHTTMPSRLEVLSGTLFIRNNIKTRYLCSEWYREASKLNKWEQQALQEVLSKHNLKIYDLPLEYCVPGLILPNGNKLNIEVEPMILHYQASRKLKKLIMG